jgi:hypothetical protein
VSGMVSQHLLFGALMLTVCAAATSPARALCEDLVGKQITLRGHIISADPLMLGGAGLDAVVIQSSEPSCGKIQTSLKLRSCHAGNSFSATGSLVRGFATRSGGSTRPDAADYSFNPTTASAPAGEQARREPSNTFRSVLRAAPSTPVIARQRAVKENFSARRNKTPTSSL